MDASILDGFCAYVTFLSTKDGGRKSPAINSSQYRPHLVVGDPSQRKAITDDASNSLEDYLGVSFEGSDEVLEPGPAHFVKLSPLYEQVSYKGLVPGATFTIREGHRIVAFGVVAPPRIYGDFNGVDASSRSLDRDAISLHRMGSLLALARLGIILTNGMKLTIYMDSDENEDIEADAEVYFDPTTEHWMAEYSHSAIRDVPRAPEWAGSKFPCVSCRTDLTEHTEMHGLKQGDTCPKCFNPIHRSILPPRVG